MHFYFVFNYEPQKLIAMKNENNKSPFTVYFLSNSGNSYLAEYIDTELYYESFDISFEEFDAEKVKIKKLAAIVVDLYFTDISCDKIITTLIESFKDEQIYFLSPEFAVHNHIFKNRKQPNHFFSSFSVDIIQHISNLIDGRENNNRDISEAS